MNNHLIRSIAKSLIFVVGYSVLLSIYFLNSDINPSIVSHIGDSTVSVSKQGKISGEIKAKYDYFSILTLNFNKSTVYKGGSVFRLKEKKSDEWLQVSHIDASQYLVYPRYNFGLPIIPDSKNKTYYFELEISKYNGEIQAVSINSDKTPVISKYKFPISKLLRNPRLFVEFTNSKIEFYTRTRNTTYILLSCFVSICIFIYLSSAKKHSQILVQILKTNFLLNKLSLILLAYVFADIFFIYESKTIISLFAILIWSSCIYIYHFKPSDSIKYGLIFLLISGYFYLFDMIYIYERAAEYFYIFFMIGIIHRLIVFYDIKIKKNNTFKFTK